MSFWHQAPCTRMLFPILAGATVGAYLSEYTVAPLALATAAFICAGAVIFIWRREKYRHVWLPGALVLLTLFFLSVQIAMEKRQAFRSDYFGNYAADGMLWKARVVDIPKVREKTIKVVLAVECLYVDTQAIALDGDLLAYFTPDSDSKELSLGQQVILKNKLQLVPGPQNPEEFNYRRYLATHNIHYQVFLKPQQWATLPEKPSFSVFATAMDIRDWCISILRRTALSKEQLAVASALILGYRSDLDVEMTQAYATAGAMHVLAVSGLHVGLIFLVFSKLFGPLAAMRHGKVLKAILLLAVIWSYAMLTGLSSSVLRAAWMFSFIVLGQTSNRHTSIYNTIAASAIILILYKPTIIMDVSFQLSYLAVVGIIYLQPKIYHLLYVKNSLLDKLWALTTVSIAAQVATFPLGFLYFHQFPNYFLISNILVIPLATMILYCGLAVLLSSFIPFATLALGYVLSFVTGFLNGSVRWIEDLPHSLTEGVFISAFECLLLYATVVAIVWWMQFWKPLALKFAIFLAILLAGIQFSEALHRHTQEKIVVYRVPPYTAIDFISGANHVFLADSACATNAKKLSYHIESNWRKNGLMQPTVLNTSMHREVVELGAFVKNGPLIQFGNTRVVLGAYGVRFADTLQMQCDLLIVQRGFYPSDLGLGMQCKQIVLDGSCPAKSVSQWTDFAEENRIPVFNTNQRGAFIFEPQ